jgi:hypothetical protein
MFIAHPAGEPVVLHRWGIQAIGSRKAGELNNHCIPVQTRNLRSKQRAKTRGSSDVKGIVLRMDPFKEHERCGAAITRAGHQQSCLQDFPQPDPIGFFTVNTGQPLAVDGKRRFQRLRNEVARRRENEQQKKSLFVRFGLYMEKDSGKNRK